MGNMSADKDKLYIKKIKELHPQFENTTVVKNKEKG